MFRSILCALVIGCALLTPVTWAAEKNLTYMDLQPQATIKLTETLGNPNNDLADLPKGEQTLGGVKFKIDDGYLQLGSATVADKPAKVEGIKVDKKFTKLYILQATHNGVEDDTIIGSYTVNYEDHSQETIAIVYGKDVLDWWYTDDSKEPTRGKVAWKGENGDAKANGAKIRLYVTTWKNPEPDKKVLSIDFSSTKSSAAAPFCVALSVEEK
jgi:hypothetical protein